MRTIAVIPAKENSYRLPNKNFLKINGKMLFQHAVDIAKDAGFDDIYVSSDTDRVFQNVRNVRTHHRKGSSDSETTIQVANDVARKCIQSGEKELIIAIVSPCNPCQDPKELRKAVDMLQNTNLGTVIGVSQEKSTIHTYSQKFCNWGQYERRENSQDRIPYYKETGLYVYKYTDESSRLLLARPVFLFQDPEKNPDINTLEDFEKCRALLETDESDDSWERPVA